MWLCQTSEHHIMNSDISEEAKKALADVKARQARQRLRRDGCISNEPYGDAFDALQRCGRSFQTRLPRW